MAKKLPSLLALFVVFILSLIAFAIFNHNVGRIEGRYFPVVGVATLDRHTPYPPPAYRNRWHATAVKNRDCSEFRRIEWFFGPRDGRRVQVRAVFLDKPKVRDAGPLEWDGLVITLDPEEVKTNSHADVIHKCPWRWWETRTPFYDPMAD